MILCISVIGMTSFVLKFSYTLYICLYWGEKKAHLYEMRAVLENQEGKVTVIMHFVAFKVGSGAAINMPESPDISGIFGAWCQFPFQKDCASLPYSYLCQCSAIHIVLAHIHH